MRKLVFYGLFLFGYWCIAQIQCPNIEEPLDGDVEVAVDARISWDKVGGISGYSVSVGTSPGASDILNSRSAALVNFLVPKTGLPANTDIYVTISLFLDDGNFITCPSEKFTTVSVIDPPQCTDLTATLANAQNVKLAEIISWDYAPTATGYSLTLGTSEGGSDILPKTDLGNVLEYDPPDNLPINSDIFVKIIPYNDIGEASNCIEFTFTTGDSNIDCEQFQPELTLNETFGICSDKEPVEITTDDVADGFRWYKVHNDGTESFIAEGRSINLMEIGQYKYEGYNAVSILGDTAECTNASYFSVVASEPATIEGVEVKSAFQGVDLTVIVSGSGNYEYAIDTENGLFQESNLFSAVSDGNHIIYVRDANGCGISEYNFIQTLTKSDFPKFFTPNNDGANDYWQFTPILDNRAALSKVYIFDRFGKLMVQLDPESIGWDGTFRGLPLPSATYWYKAVAKNNAVLNGYFALKR